MRPSSAILPVSPVTPKSSGMMPEVNLSSPFAISSVVSVSNITAGPLLSLVRRSSIARLRSSALISSILP
ncbi:hypothetical protein D1872_332150 [compost metagenome]